MTLTRTPETVTRHLVHLRIAGMTCGACADRVRRGLEQLAGTTATVNILTGTAEVRAPARYGAEDLCRAVEVAGYTAGLQPSGHDSAPAPKQRPGIAPRSAVTVLTTGTPLLALVFLCGAVGAPQFLLLAAAAAAVVGAGGPIHAAAWRAARRGHTTMDTLTSLGLMGTLGYAAAATVGGTDGGRYAGIAAAVTVVALAGRRLKRRAERRAGAALHELATQFARSATVLDDTGKETRIPVGDLREGQCFRVDPGDIVAADGLVVSGTAALDISVLTGEPTPQPIEAGDVVTAGSIALDGSLIVEAAAVGDRTRLSRLLHAVQRSHTYSGDFQRLADRIAGRFVPAVLVSAAVTGTGWLLTGGGPGSAARAGLAVLLAACPCALGLATPMALLVASGRAAQLGIFVKGQRVLEQAEGGAVVVFDKTGTLTDGAPAVVAVCPAETVSRRDVLRWAAAAESGSAHSVALAVRAAARTERLDPPGAHAVTDYPGLGVLGIVDGHRLAVGRPVFLHRHGFTVPADLAAARRTQERLGRTAVFVGVGDRVVGVIAVFERVHPGAARAVAQLHGQGLRTVLMTGDNPFAAQAVADHVGIDHVVAGVLPEDKAEVVVRRQESGKHVTVVGDGINDGPALAAADVGIALGTGADAAIEAADIVLAGRDLLRVPAAIGLAWATLATIRTNLRWAFGYNLLVVPVAALLLDPLSAAAAMALSSLFVVSNSIRLRRFTLPGDTNPETPPPHTAY
ncbi:cation-translocating P-type ATPase [Nocardia zapadnayensis]|uniref:heavy metal translocating P-type ATPase n=1 Tax=Nocardia rhamnosiphila TaxID=426716 RepID=UPI002245D123|nr:cation-translocating P-type ATPase [Nocardia zapadnayensis]MCX0272943.1 cation-translocating P-type ATPase [Nocardia zapadnayensis]